MGEAASKVESEKTIREEREELTFPKESRKFRYSGGSGYMKAGLR